MLRSSFFAISILIARLIFDAAKGLSLRTCPYLPEVSPAWRENGTQEFPQLDQFPLSVGELNASIPRYPIDRQSLAHFIHKLATTNRTSPSSPASVRVAVFGGSFTRGNGCFSTPYHQRGVRQRILCSWSHRLIRWLRAAFPNTKVDILFYAGSHTCLPSLMNICVHKRAPTHLL